MENLGTYIEDGPKQRLFLPTDVVFTIELNDIYQQYFENYIDIRSYDIIKNNLHRFKFKLYKNCALILLGYYVYSNSKAKGVTIDSNILNGIFSDPALTPMFKQYQISLADLIRYTRFYAIHLKPE